MIKVGIAGAAGYTAGELIRMLVAHPGVELRYLQSESHRGEPIGKVHRDLIYSDRVFSDLDYTDIDVLFLCMGHGVSTRFLQQNPVPASVRVIDLGNDFRLKANAGNFVYGLPERNREIIRQAGRVANPGCFATAIELGLLPLANGGVLPSCASAFGITGATERDSNPRGRRITVTGRRTFRSTRFFPTSTWRKSGRRWAKRRTSLLSPCAGVMPGESW